MLGVGLFLLNIDNNPMNICIIIPILYIAIVVGELNHSSKVTLIGERLSWDLIPGSLVLVSICNTLPC